MVLPNTKARTATRRRNRLWIITWSCLVTLYGIIYGLGNNLSGSSSRSVMVDSIPATTTNFVQDEIHALGLDQYLQASSKAPRYNPNQSSRTATVMGMATNYDVNVYKRFVGSLRATGYLGNIILAVSPTPKPGVEEYLTQEGVIMKRLNYVNCSSDILKGATPENAHAVEVMTCADPYPDLKVRWGRFALLRDYLAECIECTGPVLVADVRDTFFQRDPFGPEAPETIGLHLAEEHRTMRTTNWLVDAPVTKCKKIERIFDEPMLCSGTTWGTREAMLKYLQAMVDEMYIWMQHPDCCCNPMNGDDQSIHNYLYYTGKLPFADTAKNRVGLVHTAGVQGKKTSFIGVCFCLKVCRFVKLDLL